MTVQQFPASGEGAPNFLVSLIWVMVQIFAWLVVVPSGLGVLAALIEWAWPGGHELVRSMSMTMSSLLDFAVSMYQTAHHWMAGYLH